LKKGSVDHDCQPACELHALENDGNTTGKVKGNPGKQADSPQFAGTGGKNNGVPKSRGFHTVSSVWGKDGEEIAREHLHAEEEPQIQKETSEKGSPQTAGGAYASRDSPRAQGRTTVLRARHDVVHSFTSTIISLFLCRGITLRQIATGTTVCRKE
jgi:hypothetical protein